MNRPAHSIETGWSVPLDAVGTVADRFGWVTRIIDLRLKNGTTRTFRCFGARSFARAIRAAARLPDRASA